MQDKTLGIVAHFYQREFIMLFKPTINFLQIQVKNGVGISDRFLLPDESENYIPTAIEQPVPQNPAPWKDLHGYIIVSLSTLP